MDNYFKFFVVKKNENDEIQVLAKTPKVLLLTHIIFVFVNI